MSGEENDTLTLPSPKEEEEKFYTVRHDRLLRLAGSASLATTVFIVNSN